MCAFLMTSQLMQMSLVKESHFKKHCFKKMKIKKKIFWLDFPYQIALWSTLLVSAIGQCSYHKHL